MIVATFMITTGFFIFIYLPVLAAIIGIRSQLGKAEAVPEWASSRQTSGTENEPTRPSATSRRDAAPVINGSSQRVAPTGRYCIYCGAMISDSNWRFCGNCGASIAAPDSNQRFREINAPEENDSIGKCMVCGLAIRKSEPVAYCIYCGNVAHRLHLLEWVHVKGICPMCEEHLTEKDI
jgi:predicted nucleic acid-binding Zn ribbon protein